MNIVQDELSEYIIIIVMYHVLELKLKVFKEIYIN